jgi:hypothetical protein
LGFDLYAQSRFVFDLLIPFLCSCVAVVQEGDTPLIRFCYQRPSRRVSPSWHEKLVEALIKPDDHNDDNDDDHHIELAEKDLQNKVRVFARNKF